MGSNKILLCLMMILLWSPFRKVQAAQTQVPTPKAHREQLILEQAHQVFTESWRLLIGANESSGLSLFKASARVLSTAENDLAGAQKCQIKTGYLIQKNKITLSNVTCDKAQSQTLAAELTWQTNELLTFAAWPNQFPTAVGDSVSILNPKLECQMRVNVGRTESAAKLIAMNCTGLSQSIGRSQHVAYKEFKYSTKADQLLTVQADRYENLVQRMLCDGESPCLQLQVPNKGIIGVIEDRRKKEVVEAAPQPVAAPLPVISPTPEGPMKSQTQGLDEVKEIPQENGPPLKVQRLVPVGGAGQPVLPQERTPAQPAQDNPNPQEDSTHETEQNPTENNMVRDVPTGNVAAPPIR